MRRGLKHPPFRLTKSPNPLGKNDLGSKRPAGKQYLSTIDAAGCKADDDAVGCRQEGTPW